MVELYLNIPAAGDPFLCAVVPAGTLIESVPDKVILVNVGLSDVATACPIDTAVPDTDTPVPAVSVVIFAGEVAAPSRLMVTVGVSPRPAAGVAADPTFWLEHGLFLGRQSPHVTACSFGFGQDAFQHWHQSFSMAFAHFRALGRQNARLIKRHRTRRLRGVASENERGRVR